MTDHIEDGGPAFPVIGAPGASEDFPGVTMRDYFAAKAMPEVLAEAHREEAWKIAGPDWRYGVSLEAYAMADAMLKARKS